MTNPCPTRGPRTVAFWAAVTSVIACQGMTPPQIPLDAPNVDLQLTMAANLPTPPEGSTFGFTVTVENAGPVDARGVLAGDTLPSGLTYVSHSATMGEFDSRTGFWEIGDLPQDAVATLSLVARPASGTSGSTLVNTAGVISTMYNDTVPENNVAQASVTVSDPVPPGTYAFSSDWSTATGTSVSAVSDGGKWNGSSGDNGGATVLEVVPGTAVRGDAWTLTPNVLAIYMRGPNHDYVISRLNALPQSTTHWGRCYLMFEEGVSHQRNMHPFAYDPVGSIDLVFLNWGGGTQPWLAAVADVDYRIGIEGAGFRTLNLGEWYRYEWMVEYVTPTSVKLWPRLYSMSGTLLYDAGGFLHEDNVSFSMAEFWSTGAVTVNAAEATEIGLGQPGPAGTTDTGTATYVAACAISTEGWIGSVN
jgi:uncharacterized repeat protein (TIGR01451 family)